MDRNLALEFVRVTEAAAIAAAKWVGRGDKHAADGAAVDEMRARFNQIDFAGTVVIGEGSKDEAPELYTGEKVGTGKGPEMDLAVDPLEATDSVAHGRYNAISVIVAGAKGSLLGAPDVYMDKLAAGPKAAKVIDFNNSVETNIKNVANALGKDVKDMTVIVLERDRHNKLMEEIRAAGARVRTITDGDVAGAIAPSMADSGIDLLMGIGASTEAVLAAAAIKILGGEIFARFAPKDDKQKAAIEKAGLDLKKVFTSEGLAKGNELTFTATGVIDGPLLRGVQFDDHIITTHSIVMRASSGTVRYITAHHKVK
ncbi:MAG: fructose-bisphosphatase, class II [Candidatus Doudnabacteria bacterium RIFCSPHIGHO2_01_FULL_49_9]|uniref:Fructose-1,6-bisphosphatase n=1 Tax=Candidatus Doudnabacteria bacterium RIFCSPHIGHO2_01_FULL_49_9 TaxID=1817827 RepID=A0A1F5P2F8_9BACT|nr:MAG: fructose-bisphosphatase, class II [Candidatus Doudnabacteria bacterium RIFCSPHIGHO2_01_FULL_49_9]